jgi:hypothetical protein
MFLQILNYLYTQIKYIRKLILFEVLILKLNFSFSVVSSKMTTEFESRIQSDLNCELELIDSTSTLDSTSGLDSDTVLEKTLSSLKLADLQTLCRRLGIKISGLKPDVVKRLLNTDTIATLDLSEFKPSRQSSLKKVDDLDKVISEQLNIKIKRPRRPKRKVFKTLIPFEKTKVFETVQSMRQTLNVFKGVGTVKFIDPKSNLVFDPITHKAIGKMRENGEVRFLNGEDIQMCKEYKVSYDIPENLGTQGIFDSKLLEVLGPDDFKDDITLEDYSEEEDDVCDVEF